METAGGKASEQAGQDGGGEAEEEEDLLEVELGEVEQLWETLALENVHLTSLSFFLEQMSLVVAQLQILRLRLQHIRFQFCVIDCAIATQVVLLLGKDMVYLKNTLLKDITVSSTFSSFDIS